MKCRNVSQSAQIFGVARIPVDRMQRMTVLLRILGKTQSKVKRHRIAENQYGLGNTVCLGLYDLSCQRICTKIRIPAY